MSELYETSNVETAGSTGDSGAGRGLEVGESGPAGFVESAVDVGGDVLRDAGKVATEAEAIGSEGLKDVGKLESEIGESGPASPMEASSGAQFESPGDSAETTMAWHIDASFETGESGPAAGAWETATEAVAEFLEIAAEEVAAEATEHNLPPADRAREEGRGR